MPGKRFILVLALLVGGCTLAVIGTTDSRVSLSSLLSIFSDVARDTDQAGMRLTRVSDADEVRIGDELSRASGGFGREDSELAAYVTEAGSELVRRVRRPGIHYRFHVVNSAAMNAFALPGGQIFVTTGLIRFLESEAELAAVLGHEIAHVDLRHCVERYQYEYRLKQAGMPEIGWMAEMAHRLATIGFAPYQELDADAGGEAMAVEAGYDPAASEQLFFRMKARFREPSRPRATSPGGELTESVADAIGAFFRAHPPSEERARRLHELARGQHDTLAGRQVYIGKENLRRRVARSRLMLAGEFRRM